jgi:hypothetical protein
MTNGARKAPIFDRRFINECASQKSGKAKAKQGAEIELQNLKESPPLTAPTVKTSSLPPHALWLERVPGIAPQELPAIQHFSFSLHLLSPAA